MNAAEDIWYRIQKFDIGSEGTNAPLINVPFTNVPFANVSDMISNTNLAIGDIAYTLGSVNMGDGGGNYYEIVAAGTGISDGGRFIDLVTHQAKGLFPGHIRYLKQWGAMGDNTDRTAQLTGFFESAIENNGTVHKMQKGVFLVSEKLPVLNKSGIQIQGAGCSLHDTGDNLQHTFIKWIGAVDEAMVEISSVSGVSNQKVTDIKFTDIGLDCNSLAGHGLLFNSISKSKIDVTVLNAKSVGMNMNVVANLAEAKDSQDNDITFFGRQVEEPNGVALRLGGDSLANVSLNKFKVVVQHINAAGIVLDNSDNNDWLSVRIFHPAGAATESISCMGGATEANTCRNERFHYLSTTLPLRAHTDIEASIGIQIFSLDVSNGTPAPIIDAGASVSYKKDLTPFGDTPWISYTPIVTALTGIIADYTATGRYQYRGGVIHVAVQLNIIDNGTGGTVLDISAPLGFGVAGIGTAFSGQERAITGKQLSAYAEGSVIRARFYDGSYPGGNGYAINISGFYETI